MYVFVAHMHQEMLNANSTFLPTFFYVLPEGRYSIFVPAAKTFFEKKVLESQKTLYASCNRAIGMIQYLQVGAGIPVGVYVFVAHMHQEMLNANSTFLPTFFYVLPEGRCSLVYYLSIIIQTCQ